MRSRHCSAKSRCGFPAFAVPGAAGTKSALMTYRVAPDFLRHMFPIDAGNDPETLRFHTLKIGADLRDQPVVRPDAAAPAITVTLDSTFIRSCEDGERHLEVRVGNVETASGGRQVLGAVAKADTDI